MLKRLAYLSLIGVALLLFAETVEARGRGCGGGRGGCGGGRMGRGGRGGCGGGGCGMAMGGCGGGGCGMAMGGCGTAMGGCGGYGGGMGMGYAGMGGVAAPYVANTPAPANLMVTLPADARLFVDGHETKSTTGQRLLTTPNLEPGREYHYTLRAEVTRDGQVQHVSQRITVRAGQETPVNLQIPDAVASR